MRLVEATLTFVEERKCHLENQQLAVTGLQGDYRYLIAYIYPTIHYLNEYICMNDYILII